MVYNCVYGQGVKLTFEELTLKLAKEIHPDPKPNNELSFESGVKDNSLNDNCLIFDNLTKWEKRKLIEMHNNGGNLPKYGKTTRLFVNLARSGCVIAKKSPFGGSLYSLTKRGAYVANVCALNAKI